MMRIPAPIRFLFVSIAAQLIGFSLGVLLRDVQPQILSFAVHSGGAFAAARILALPLPWQLLNALLPWLVVLGANYTIPPWTIFAVGALYLLVYLPTFWTRVPYYPTSRPMYDEVLKLLPNDKEFRFMDVGCGFGPLLLYLAANRPRGRFVGCEIGILPFFVSWIRSIGKRNITIRYKNFWRINFNDYDIVYAFLSPTPMPRLWAKAASEMRPNTLLLSNTFEAPTHPSKTATVSDARKSTLYIYEMDSR